jgi:hypothetical protein
LFFIGTTLAVFGIIFIGIFIGNRLVPYSFIGVRGITTNYQFCYEKVGTKIVKRQRKLLKMGPHLN